MQHTLAFAPTEDDLQDFYFDLPVISLAPLDAPAPADVADAEPQQVATT
jgi:hypothetical protein